ncbi:queuosine precursor transporter [Paenibacillus puerhi]|uniref:queuosine precursor transporter n=1 Tax=Paenibacillus puerhi TaxID=2692622 RepID=UPI00135B6D17|nr:queuosine precursor transporter [Paenibacillus puerhi]
MFHLLWGALFVLVHFGCFLLCYRLFGKNGLYAWVGIATILANIQVTKTIEMVGIVMTLGNTMYASIYLTSDLLNERYGEKEARKAVWFGFFVMLVTMVTMKMTLVFTPQESDFAQDSLATIFGLLPRLALGSLTAFFVSQFLDVKIYSYLKRVFPKPGQLWLRNNGSTAVSQMVDTLIFCSIAFLGEYTMEVWVQILITTYIVKFIVSMASTPFLYIARSFKFKEEEAVQA